MKQLTFLALLYLPFCLFSDYGPESPDWYAVNDSVMGGISVGGPLVLENGSIRFAGILSLENNGGFSSMRAESDAFAMEPGKDILLTVKGDGRSYNFDLRTSRRQRSFTYRQSFQTKADEITEVRLPFSGFYATRFGRRMLQAEPLKPSDVGSIGITISDGKPGPFRLDLVSVELVDPIPPRMVSVDELLELAIQRGVPLYNRGDADACVAVYETALMSLLLLSEDKLPEASRKIVQSTLSANSALNSADDKAWTLRRGIDQLLN